MNGKYTKRQKKSDKNLKMIQLRITDSVSYYLDLLSKLRMNSRPASEPGYEAVRGLNVRLPLTGAMLKA